MDWEHRVGRRLRLKDLHTLQVVAEVGSMAKASQRLAISQPAISKAISDMEHTLGVPLLDRSARGVELTEHGRVLVERARVVFDEVKQGIKEIEHLADPTQGEVRIGVIEPVAAVLSEIIRRLMRQYPRITYHVTVGDTDMLAGKLRDRALDVVLTRWNALTQADDLVAETLYTSVLAIVADRSHPMVTRKRLTLADLMKEQWALPAPDTFPWTGDRRFVRTEKAAATVERRDDNVHADAPQFDGEWSVLECDADDDASASNVQALAPRA
jgi:DNA-binding transcriptional LysR family regulator